MMVLLLVDVQALLLLFKGDTESNLGTKHHLCAFHIIVYCVFEDGLESLRIHQIEVDLIVGNNLESLITLDIVKLSFQGKLKVLFPVHIAGIFIFL